VRTRALQSAAFLAIGLGLTACGGNVVVDASATGTTTSTGASGTTTSTTTGAGGAGEGGAPSSAVHVLVTTIADPNGPCFANPPPPNAVFVLLANRPLSCSQTLPAGIADYGDPGSVQAGFEWELCWALQPNDLDLVTLPNDSGSIIQSWGEVREEDVNGSTPCMGEGPLFQGSLTFTSIQASTVGFTLQGTTFGVCGGGNVNPDAAYVAPRCP
jgi:hypothetical protein